MIAVAINPKLLHLGRNSIVIVSLCCGKPNFITESNDRSEWWVTCLTCSTEISWGNVQIPAWESEE